MTLMWEIDIHASPLSPSTRACCLPPEAIRHQTETATYLHWRYNAPPSVYQHNQQLSKQFQQCQFQHNINKGVWIHHSFLWAVFIWCFMENSICKSSVSFKIQKMESGRYNAQISSENLIIQELPNFITCEGVSWWLSQ